MFLSRFLWSKTFYAFINLLCFLSNVCHFFTGACINQYLIVNICPLFVSEHLTQCLLTLVSEVRGVGAGCDDWTRTCSNLSPESPESVDQEERDISVGGGDTPEPEIIFYAPHQHPPPSTHLVLETHILYQFINQSPVTSTFDKTAQSSFENFSLKSEVYEIVVSIFEMFKSRIIYIGW